MLRRAGRALSVGALVGSLLPGVAWAAGGKPATKLVSVADTRHLTGLAKWIGDVYNTNLWLYGVLVVVTMVLMGLVLGTVFDRLLVKMGLELGRLEHHE
jgi:hypothetical protein